MTVGAYTCLLGTVSLTKKQTAGNCTWKQALLTQTTEEGHSLEEVRLKSLMAETSP